MRQLDNAHERHQSSLTDEYQLPDGDPNSRIVRVPCEKCDTVLHGRVAREHIGKRWTLKETHSRLDNGAPCDGTASFTVASW